MSENESHSPPLFPIEVRVRNHALLCSIGFLILLPIGALIPRYLRTFTKWWWIPHAFFQFLLAAPIIFAGWAEGHKAASLLLTGHFNDPHKKAGLALLILYIIQLVIGTFIHFVKIRIPFPSGRPPQNYFHATLGLAILALAAFQVHYGITTEWALGTGNIHPVPSSAMKAWKALIIIFWVLYGLGLALLPRQYSQEHEAKQQLNKEDKLGLQMTGSRA